MDNAILEHNIFNKQQRLLSCNEMASNHIGVSRTNSFQVIHTYFFVHLKINRICKLIIIGGAQHLSRKYNS